MDGLPLLALSPTLRSAANADYQTARDHYDAGTLNAYVLGRKWKHWRVDLGYKARILAFSLSIVRTASNDDGQCSQVKAMHCAA